MGALIALARTVLVRGGGGSILRRGAALLPAVGAGFGGVALGEQAFGGDGEFRRRRRRRKALTDSDVKTALTIASAISKKAAENFILVRTRGQ